MGNEGKGISLDIQKLVTNKLFIPNYPPNAQTSESLNVAVATAIVCSNLGEGIFRHKKITYLKKYVIT